MIWGALLLSPEPLVLPSWCGSVICGGSSASVSVRCVLCVCVWGLFISGESFVLAAVFGRVCSRRTVHEAAFVCCPVLANRVLLPVVCAHVQPQALQLRTWSACLHIPKVHALFFFSRHCAARHRFRRRHGALLLHGRRRCHPSSTRRRRGPSWRLSKRNAVSSTALHRAQSLESKIVPKFNHLRSLRYIFLSVSRLAIICDGGGGDSAALGGGGNGKEGAESIWGGGELSVANSMTHTNGPEVISVIRAGILEYMMAYAVTGQGAGVALFFFLLILLRYVKVPYGTLSVP